MRFKKSSRSSGKSSIMAQLLESHAPRVIARGMNVEGTVVRVTGRQVVIDIGGKSEGVVEGREFDAVRDFVKRLTPGQKINAVVVNPEAESGAVLLSIRNIAEGAQWNELTSAYRENRPVTVVGDRMTRGGLSITIHGLPGFIPNSHLSSLALRDPTKFLATPFEALIVEIDRENDRIVLSERAITEREMILEQKEVITKLIPGQSFVGQMIRLTPKGAVVRIMKDDVALEGFVRGASQTLPAVGETIDVTIASATDGNIIFALGGVAWERVKEQYPGDMKINGKVIRVTDTTVFVEIPDRAGICAVIPANKIPPGTSVAVGQSVECSVESFDDKKQRIILGILLKAKPIGYK